MKNSGNCKFEHKATIGYTLEGKPVRKSFYGKSKREAKQKADNYIIEHGRAEKDPAGRITFGQLHEMYMEYQKNLIRANSMSHYESISKHILNVFKDIPLSKISKMNINKFAADFSEKYTDNYVRNALGVMSSVFSYGIDNGIITNNPCRGIKYKSKVEKKERSVYTKEEADAILAYALKHPEGLSVHIMLSYGTTISETLGIQYNDIDFTAGTINISRSVTKTRGKIHIEEPKNQHRKRTIAVSQETLDYIERIHDKEYTYIVHDESKTEPFDPQRWRWAIYKKFMTAAQTCLEDKGIDIEILNPHELRHTRATLWVEEDVNLFAIAEEMGWTDLEMLKKVYGHPDIQKIKSMLRIDSDKEKSQPKND